MQATKPSLSLFAQRLPLGVLLCLFAVYVIWGSTYLALRIAVAEIPPFFLMGTRFIVAGVILFFFLKLRGAA
jgi:drug/metabolite transporter (DMT)-like permease